MSASRKNFSDCHAPAVNSLQSFKSKLDAKLDPKLRKLVVEFTADERRELLQTFRRWADQLAGGVVPLKLAEKMHEPASAILN